VKWHVARAAVEEKCYEHPADIPLEKAMLLLWFVGTAEEVTAYGSPHTLPTTYDVEVQLTEYGNWQAYRAKILLVWHRARGYHPRWLSKFMGGV